MYEKAWQQVREQREKARLQYLELNGGDATGWRYEPEPTPA